MPSDAARRFAIRTASGEDIVAPAGGIRGSGWGRDINVLSQATRHRPKRRGSAEMGRGHIWEFLSSNDQVERPRYTAIYEALYRSRSLQPIVR